MGRRHRFRRSQVRVAHRNEWRQGGPALSLERSQCRVYAVCHRFPLSLQNLPSEHQLVIPKISVPADSVPHVPRTKAISNPSASTARPATCLLRIWENKVPTCKCAAENIAELTTAPRNPPIRGTSAAKQKIPEKKHTLRQMEQASPLSRMSARARSPLTRLSPLASGRARECQYRALP